MELRSDPTKIFTLVCARGPAGQCHVTTSKVALSFREGYAKRLHLESPIAVGFLQNTTTDRIDSPCFITPIFEQTLSIATQLPGLAECDNH